MADVASPNADPAAADPLAALEQRIGYVFRDRELLRSAERSQRRKSSPYASAMSMLTFYENRAGRNLSAERRRAIRQAKAELRKLYGR